MPQHRIITDALDFIQTRFDAHSELRNPGEKPDEPTITLPLCGRSMFTALSPSIVDSLFLTVDRIQFFCDFCPTYEYVTALRFREFDRDLSFEIFDVALSRELFVKLSKPLRFLKTVRFQLSSDLVLAPEIGDELVKRPFLAPGLLQTFSYRTYTGLFEATMKVEKMLPKSRVPECVRGYHLQLLCALLFHNREDVREHAAYCIGHILNDTGITRHRMLLREFQATVMKYSPPLSWTEAAAAKNETLATQPRGECILKHLFALLDRPCRNESAWISYIHCARMLYFRNTDIDFETHVKPYIPTLRYLLTAASDRLPEEIAFLFSDLLEHRDEAWMVKFLESGFFEIMVDMLRETAQELDRSHTDDDNNNRKESTPPTQLPSYFYPVIRVLGNFSLPSQEMSRKVIEYNFFELIKPRLVVSDKRNTPPLRMQLCWACSNFVSSFKLEFLDAGLLPLILDNAFDVENHTVQREACFCLASFVRFDPDQGPLRHRCFEAVFAEADRFVQAMKLFFMTNSTVTFSPESSSENNDHHSVTAHGAAAAVSQRSWGTADQECGRWCLDAIQSCLHTELCMCQVFCQKILVILHQARKKKLQRDHGSSGAAPSLRLCFEEIPDLVSYVSNVEAVAKIFQSLHKAEFDQDNDNDSDDEKVTAAMNCETSLQALSDILELELKMKTTKNRNKIKTVQNEVEKIQEMFKSVTNRLRTIDETSDDESAADVLSFEEPGLSIEEKDLIIGCYLSTMLDNKTRQTPSPEDDDNNENQETQLDDEIVEYYLSEEDDVDGLKTWPVLIPDQESATIINRNKNENEEEEEEEKDDDALQECTGSKQRAKINSYKIARPEPKFFRAICRANIDVSKVEQLQKVVRRAGMTASETLKMSVSFFDHNIYAEKFLNV